MHINYEKLKGNHEALGKYKNREARCYCEKRGLWLTEKGLRFTKDKKEAVIRTIFEWDSILFYCSDEIRLILYFVSEIDDIENKVNLTELTEDDIYNNINVKFDRFTSSMLGKIGR